jgi:glutamyl-tRNA synthetase
MMRISHVIRGEEWLSSTPKHVLLYQSFGWDIPAFAHLPLLLNPDRSKLSKRQGDVAVEDYRSKHYLKEALINFVAFLGWNPGDERELFSLDELVNEFSLERVGKAGAIFNLDKLNWLNFQHLRKKPDDEVLTMLKTELQSSQFARKDLPDDYLRKVIRALRERVTFITEFIEKGNYFFEPPAQYDPEIVKKRWKPDVPAHLRVLSEAFSKLQNPSMAEYEQALQSVAQSLGVGNGHLIHGLRLAVSGVGAGPGVYEILDVIGKEETVRRIQTAIATIK